MNKVYLKINRTEIAYKMVGEGVPVLMIHGLMLDHTLMMACMEPVFAGLESSWKRIYIDLPGMGLSPPIINSSSNAVLDIVDEFISIICPNGLSLVGYSYGAYIALGILSKRKDAIKGLFLFCPVIIADKAKRNPAVVLPKNPSREYDEIVTKSTELEIEILNGLAIPTLAVWQRIQDEVMVGLKKANMNFITKLESQYTLSCETERLGIWTEPYYGSSLILCGKEDNVVGYTDAFRLLDNMPRASFLVLASAGHNLQIEQSETFIQLASNWLKAL